jgi:hypothetical protein
MKMLLEAQNSPVTNCWGFLEAPLESIVKRAMQWEAELKIRQKRERGEELHRFESGLSYALKRLEPLNVWKTLYMTTDSEWTAVFTEDESCPKSQIGYLSKQMQCRGLLVTAVEDTYDEATNKGQYGGVQFSLYASEVRPGEILADRRVIAVINNGSRWEFHQEGPEEPFERPECYSARRVRDRFTDEMLEEYCLALGIRLFDPEFYGPHCALFAPKPPNTPNFRPETYADVRARLGLV